MSAPYEALLAFIAAQLPQPVRQDEEEDGVMVLTGGQPPEVIVRLLPAAAIVSEYSVTWERPQMPVVKPLSMGSVKWRRMSEEDAMRAVKALITAARNSRLARFRLCSVCGQRHPPEWMHSRDICIGCAERESDVVH